MTPAEAQRHFRDHGISVAGWAKEHGFSAPLVYAVLTGKSRALRGESFRIAVALGIRQRPDEPFQLNLTPQSPGGVPV